MSICVSVKVPDGLVLGTDSLTRLTRRLPDRQLKTARDYSRSRRLFRVGDSLGIATYGGDFVAPSIETLVTQFCRDADQRRVGGFTNQLFDFMKSRYDQAYPASDGTERPAVGFFVGGYSEGARYVEEWEFSLPDCGKAKSVRNVSKFGLTWRGAVSRLPRLLGGFDPQIPEELSRLGVSKEIVAEVFNGKRELPIAYEGMSIQDALDLTAYLLNTEIGAAAFEPGVAPSCGGPLQMAVIQPNIGWTWINEFGLAIGTE